MLLLAMAAARTKRKDGLGGQEPRTAAVDAWEEEASTPTKTRGIYVKGRVLCANIRIASMNHDPK